ETVQRGPSALSLYVLGNKFIDGRLIRCVRENCRSAERADDERNYEAQMHRRFGVRYETSKGHGYSDEVETQALLQANVRGTSRRSRVFKSCISLSTERLNWIDVCGAPRRDQTRN